MKVLDSPLEIRSFVTLKACAMQQEGQMSKSTKRRNPSVSWQATNTSNVEHDGCDIRLVQNERNGSRYPVDGVNDKELNP